MKAIQRGDIYRVLFGQTKGHELKDPHYAVVVQSAFYPLSTVLVVPLSSSVDPAPWHVPVDIQGRTSYALVEQLRAVDIQSRLREYIGSVAGTDTLDQIDEELAIILGLHELYREAGE